ncbi:MAG: hypothetical protein ILP23_04820 [Paludibacteraceae bacterium]|nr:hypothetical protein [Paludibacteraceae bacterium]
MNIRKIYMSALAVSFSLSTMVSVAQSDVTIGDIVSQYGGTDSSISAGLSSLGIQDLTLSSLMQNEEFLTSAVASVNGYMPMPVGYGVTLKRVDIDSLNITLAADYDEADASVKTVKNNPALFKSYLKKSVKNNSDVKMLLDVLKGTNRGVVFVIHGTKSKSDATVTFTTKEIQSLAAAAGE